jgi:hypothetical protein
MAIALTGLLFAMPSASAQDAGDGYGPPNNSDNASGPPPGYGDAYASAPECNPANYASDQAIPPACLSQAYCDEYGCPDVFYDMPIWYGPVFYGSVWFAGPVYYRIRHGQRQYWIHGGWHYDTWRGPHPSWWNAGHYHTGPAVGRAYYRNHGAGTAVTSVRVWRGTQSSTYHDSGGGQYFGRGIAGGGLNPPTALRPIGSVNVKAQHPSQQRATQYHYNGAHNFVASRNHSFNGSGYHGGRR